jgi:hypothetical protein
MAITVVQRRALDMLAGSPDGCAMARMLAAGFDIGTLHNIVRDGLATAGRQGETKIVRLRITDAGRQALAG